MSEEQPDIPIRASKLDRLVRERETTDSNPRWSRFVRRARLLLPLAALALFAVVFVWSDVQHNNIIPAQPASKTPAIGKNELVNPTFNSVDSKNQPYTVTANRAIQSKDDTNLILLDAPTGNMTLNSGSKLAIRSDRGSYREDTKILLLRGAVKLSDDRGNIMNTEQLDINMDLGTTKSETDVTGNGPDGTLNAKGLQGSNMDGTLVFNGPAKLVLTNVSGGPKGMMP